MKKGFVKEFRKLFINVDTVFNYYDCVDQVHWRAGYVCFFIH
jgi:hypothetical protein